jgi:hypothetical protein
VWMYWQGSNGTRYGPKMDFHGHGDDPWGFDDETFSSWLLMEDPRARSQCVGYHVGWKRNGQATQVLSNSHCSPRGYRQNMWGSSWYVRWATGLVEDIATCLKWLSCNSPAVLEISATLFFSLMNFAPKYVRNFYSSAPPTTAS